MNDQNSFNNKTNMNVNARAWRPGGGGAPPTAPAPSFSSSAPSFTPNQSAQTHFPQQSTSFQPFQPAPQQMMQTMPPPPAPQGGYMQAHQNFGGNGGQVGQNYMNQNSYQQHQPYQPQQQQFGGYNKSFGGNNQHQQQVPSFQPHNPPDWQNSSQPQAPVYNQNMQGGQQQYNKPYNKHHGGGGGNQQWNNKPYNNYNGNQKTQYMPKNQRQGDSGQQSYNNFPSGGFNDFTNQNSQYSNNGFKPQNVQLQTGFQNPNPPSFQPTQPSTQSAGAADPAPWRRFTKRGGATLNLGGDKEKEQLAKCGVTDADQVQKIKDLLVLLKSSKDKVLTGEQEKTIAEMRPCDPPKPVEGETAAPGVQEEQTRIQRLRGEYLDMNEARSKLKTQSAFNMRLFLQIGQLAICQTQDSKSDDLKHVASNLMVDREVADTLDHTSKGRPQKGGQYNQGRPGRNDRPGGGRPHHANGGRGGAGNVRGGGKDNEISRQEVDAERAELREKAKQMKERMLKPKNVTSKIKLILNVITPDNFEKKRDELRAYLFGDQCMTRDEAFNEQIEFDPKKHQLQEDGIDPTNLEIIVQTIFKKAQMEKEYIIFYGQLCEQLIRIELQLRGLECKVATMKQSSFRKYLFDQCVSCFSKFFDAEEKRKHTETLAKPNDTAGLPKEEREQYLDDLERAVVFQTRLFGNNEFVGELYRRKLLAEQTLSHVFESLLGLSELNSDVDDLVVEGAINLMDKVGQCFEENVKKRAKDSKFPAIIARFQQLMDLPDDDEKAEIQLSKRVKLLIKNMFTNRESGWQRTQDMNQAGPKTKKEVRKEVEDKHAREQREREEGRHGHGNRDGNQRQGQGNYNDKGDRKGGRDGGRGGDNRRDGGKPQYQEKKNQYQQKGGKGGEPDSPTKKGRGGGRKEDKKEAAVEIIELDDGEMGEQLKTDFEAYCSAVNDAGNGGDDDEEETKTTPESVKPNYELYDRLKTENGKKGEQILAQLLSRVFDEDTAKVEEHLTNYLMHLYNDKQANQKDFNGAISRMADFLPDLALDLPMVHQYLMKYVIDPLLEKKVIDWKKINWVTPEDKSAKAEDEDEDFEFGTEPFFKLLALIFRDQQKNGANLKDFTKPWEQVIKEKKAKIESEDDLLADINEELGAEVAAAIIPFLQLKGADEK